MFQPIQTRLAGVTFDDCQANIRQWGCHDIGSFALIREPEYQFDSNAVCVSLFGIHYVGYLHRSLAKRIAPLMDDGRIFLTKLVRRNDYPPYKRVGLTERIVETTR